MKFTSPVLVVAVTAAAALTGTATAFAPSATTRHNPVVDPNSARTVDPRRSGRVSIDARFRRPSEPLYVSSTSEQTIEEEKRAARAKDSGNDASNPFTQWMTQQKTSLSASTVSADEEPVRSGLFSNLDDYTKGFATIAFITFLNASTNPLWHGAFANGGPPPLLLNAAVAVVAWAGLAVGGSTLDSNVGTIDKLADAEEDDSNLGWQQWFGGVELGFWKFLGTTSHLYGLSMTSANHGAFLIQLTTLIVPVIQGLRGEKIPGRIQAAVGLALLGVYAFTQDPNGAIVGGNPDTQTIGDLLCIACAFFYSFYDIQTFKWGRIVPRAQLVTTKIATQAVLSVGLCAALAYDDTTQFFQSHPNFLTEGTLVPVVLWSGLIVNALATFLQVGGMQAVGPTRAQTIFASQPLWSSALAYAFLGETIGIQGAFGGTAFLFALYLAATAPKEETIPVEDSA